jgi:RNA polymerase sigma-70 factor (ECF subfamily)
METNRTAESSAAPPAGTGPAGNEGAFTATHWSVVLAAREAGSPQAAAALERLCRTYWYPLYVYVRRRGHSPEDAQDLTQQFFANLLRKGSLGAADPARGKFRTFLLHALERFLVNEWKRARRLKRGGGVPALDLDVADAEGRYGREPSTSLTPERAYEKRWAAGLLEGVLADLRQEYARADQARVFEALAERLWGKGPGGSRAEIGAGLGMTEGAVGAALHRLRQRFRERLRAAVAHTVADPGEVDVELRHLLAVVSQQE